MVNEYGGLDNICETPQRVPYGSTYNDVRYQACMFPGASNSTYVDGLAYLQEQYSYSKGHPSMERITWNSRVPTQRILRVVG